MLPTLQFQRIRRRLRLRHVHNAVHVEGDLLRRRRPRLVAETIQVFAILGRLERVVAVRYAVLVSFEGSGGGLDLDETW